MSNTAKIIGAIIVVAVIVLGAWAFMSMRKTPESAAPSPKSQDSNSAGQNDNSEVGVVIVYNNEGFSPAVFSVKSGQKVKILNETDETIEFASDPHPTHTTNPEMNSGDIEPAGTKEITVTRKGEWGFHNHFNPSRRGTMTVE